MLDTIRRWLSKEPEVRYTPVRQLNGMPAPRVPRYDSSLISSLKHDHHNLVAMFEQLGRLAEIRSYAPFDGMLASDQEPDRLLLASHLRGSAGARLGRRVRLIGRTPHIGVPESRPCRHEARCGSPRHWRLLH